MEVRGTGHAVPGQCTSQPCSGRESKAPSHAISSAANAVCLLKGDLLLRRSVHCERKQVDAGCVDTCTGWTCRLLSADMPPLAQRTTLGLSLCLQGMVPCNAAGLHALLTHAGKQLGRACASGCRMALLPSSSDHLLPGVKGSPKD